MSDDRFAKVLNEIHELHDRKQKDYGLPNDEYANVRGGEEWGIDAWVSAMVRASDKVRRLQAFARKGVLENEGAEDSLLDLATYAIIALVLFRETDERRATPPWVTKPGDSETPTRIESSLTPGVGAPWVHGPDSR